MTSTINAGKAFSTTEEAPLGVVSVIIPARNEEENIERAVRSIATQGCVREVVVVDDDSSDRTGEILRTLQNELPALHLIRIASLPQGWVGKSYAAATGVKKATGKWLLFTDADTEHLPGSLRRMLEHAEGEGADLLSLSPGQQTVAWWEKSVVPYVFVLLARRYRFDRVSEPMSPQAAANGQYLLIRRDAYDRIGGHEAVREEILEDVEIARRVKASGGKLIFLPGASWVRTRMYRKFSEMWQGWSKNLYLLLGRSVWGTLRMLVEVWVLDLGCPIIFLVLCFLIVLAPRSATILVWAILCFAVAALRQWSYGVRLAQLGFDPNLANYQVLGAGLFAILLLNSARMYRLRGAVRWKGRDYLPPERRREEE